MKDKIVILIKIINNRIRKSEAFRKHDFEMFTNKQIEKNVDMFLEFKAELTDDILIQIEHEVNAQWNRHHETYWKFRDINSCFYIGIRKAIPRTIGQIREKSPWVNYDVQALLEVVNEASMKVFGEPMTFQAGSVETIEKWAKGMEIKEWKEIVGMKMKYCKDKNIPPIERWNLIADKLHEWSKSEKAEFAPFVKIEKFGITQK